VIPGGRAREFLRQHDPGFNWPERGLTEGSRGWLILYQGAGIVALILVVATLAVPRTTPSRVEAKSLGFGYPLAFVSVDETVWNPPSYPQTYRFDPWDDIADVHGLPFVLDWIFWTAVLWIPIWLVRRRVTRRRKSPSPG
jgi:hypothetical protein